MDGRSLGTDAAPPLSAAQQATAKQWRVVVVALTLALILLGLAWELVLAPTGSKSLALKVVPLALTLRGLATMRLRSYRIMSLLVWLYAAEGSMRMASERGVSAQLAVVELLLALALFVACAMHVRARTKHLPKVKSPKSAD